MRLANLKEFCRLFYTEESAPCLNTLRASINRNEQPGGVRVGRRYYVDLDEFDRVSNLTGKLIERRKQLAQCEELEGLL